MNIIESLGRRSKSWLARAGIASGPAFNHSDFCWKTRLLPRVSDAFSTVTSPQYPTYFTTDAVRPSAHARQVWGGDDDLIVSFDGGNAFRPWKINRSWSTKGGWWHVDQVCRFAYPYVFCLNASPELPSRSTPLRARVCAGPGHVLRRH